MKARAFWTSAPGRGEIREETLAARGEDEVVVRALFSGVSRGTESLVFHGRVPRAEYERMRAPFQAGSFPAPVKYGYSSVGVVEDGPRTLLNRRVFALYPHQTHYCVPASAVHRVPDEVPSERAVLAANLETAINGVWDAQPSVGDHVVVIGGGVVGCLVAWLVGRIPGTDVTLIDVRQERGHVAERLGVAFAIPDFAPTDADVVVHASGSPIGLQLALRLAAFEATVLELSWYGDWSVALPLGEAFHARRLTLRSSQVGHVAPPQRPRWSHRRRMALALNLLKAPALDVLISGESPFDELPALMPTLAAGDGDVLCHRIRYS
ncbi:MAG: zinc-binding alcohol dehydrogenase [Acidimicrobiia bacterium]|nr:zinc-binding alcohol dehydrogenase [Acidimicrobiia bacterium]